MVGTLGVTHEELVGMTGRVSDQAAVRLMFALNAGMPDVRGDQDASGYFIRCVRAWVTQIQRKDMELTMVLNACAVVRVVGVEYCEHCGGELKDSNGEPDEIDPKKNRVQFKLVPEAAMPGHLEKLNAYEPMAMADLQDRRQRKAEGQQG